MVPAATDSAADEDTTAPNRGALDSPVHRRLEMQRMYRVLGADSALALFRYRLSPRPAHVQLIKTFGDTVTP